MTYVPDSSLLRGLPVEEAECFGKPHLMALYAGDGAKKTRLLQPSVCAACGKPATNAHHEPPLGMGGRNRVFVLRSKWGQFPMRPALIALCGSGTTGCHGRRHNGKLKFRWEWHTDEAARMWWTGQLLSHGIEPHDPGLYELGRWVVEDGHGRFEVRG